MNLFVYGTLKKRQPNHSVLEVVGARFLGDGITNETYPFDQDGARYPELFDEAPMAYKNIFEVMELQSDLVEVVDRVVPILNIKG